MKKMVSIMMMVLMVIGLISIAEANTDPIWEDVYEFWKEENADEYELFINTDYNSSGFAKDGVAYMAGYNISLWYDEYHDLDYINEYFKGAAVAVGIKNYTTNVNCIGEDEIGRYVIELKLSTSEDLREIEDGGFEQFDEPIYEMVMICYDRNSVPERW